MDRDPPKIINIKIRGAKQSLCQVRNRSAQTGGSMGHRNLLATSFAMPFIILKKVQFKKRRHSGNQKNLNP